MSDKLPRHSNPTPPRPDDKSGKQIEARAPYNFVPLPEEVVKAREPLSHDEYHKGEGTGGTGWIDCELETCSPTYIRGMLTETQWQDHRAAQEAGGLTPKQKKEAADFFSTGGEKVEGHEEPVIPGSSLRGMVRALVEIAGWGRMRWVADNQLVYRAVGDSTALGTRYREQILGRDRGDGYVVKLDYPSPLLKGGYLEKHGGGWAIRPAKEFLGESFIHVEYSDANPIIGGYGRHRTHPVFVEPVGRTTSNRGRKGRKKLILNLAITPKVGSRFGDLLAPTDLVPAWLVESGHMTGRSRKHWHCAIYEADNRADLIPISANMWAAYEEDQKLAHGEGTGTRKLGQSGDPLFYLLDQRGRLVFFGPTMMLRLPYMYSISDYIPKEHKEHKVPDLADALFGWVDDAGEEPGGPAGQRAGRLSFGDARLHDAEGQIWCWAQPITPHILSTPKPTTFQHYLVQDRERDHDPDDKSKLAHYDTPPNATTIRGHKLYWHKGAKPDIEATVEERKLESQLTRIVPLQPGVRFRFRIRFENLREEELGALLWALSLPGEEGKEYRHKLGMGKPLGMGAVKITPRLFLTERHDKEKGRYAKLFAGEDWHEAAGEGEMEPYVQRFEEYVIEQITDKPKGAQRLREVPRIQALLAMLEWPGPAPELTSYMEIERGADKVNEYKERPVLTDPLLVGRGQPVDTSVAPGASRGQVTPPPAAPPAQAARRETPPQPARPAGPTLPEPGTVFTSTVLDADETAVLVEIPGFPRERAIGLIRAERLGGKQYHSGGLARVEVIEIRTLKDGRTVVELKVGVKKGKR